MDQALADRLLIRELMDRYCDAINQRDWDIFPDFWTEDAVWECAEPFNFRAVGRAEVLKLIWQARSKNEFLVQMPHAIVIDSVSGDIAHEHHTLHLTCRSTTGTGYSSIGIYFDELRRTADGWRFSKRNFRPFWHDPNPPSGFIIPAAVQPKSPGHFDH